MINDDNDGATAASVFRRTGFHAEVQPLLDGCVVIRLHGELDMATTPMLNRALASALNSGGTQVVVDLASLTFMDSTGIAVLLNAGRRAEESGGSLVVRSPNRAVLRAFRLTGVDSILVIEADGSLAT